MVWHLTLSHSSGTPLPVYGVNFLSAELLIHPTINYRRRRHASRPNQGCDRETV